MQVYATGAREGQTFTFGNYSFVNGICDIAGEEPELRYLQVNLQVGVVGEKDADAVETSNTEETDPLRAAILQLDPDDDANWNNAGQPAIAALFEFGSVTRKQVEAVAHDLTRDVVRAKQ